MKNTNMTTIPYWYNGHPIDHYPLSNMATKVHFSFLKYLASLINDHGASKEKIPLENEKNLFKHNSELFSLFCKHRNIALLDDSISLKEMKLTRFEIVFIMLLIEHEIEKVSIMTIYQGKLLVFQKKLLKLINVRINEIHPGVYEFLC